MQGMGLRFRICELFWQPIRGSLVFSLVLIFLYGTALDWFITCFVCSIWFFVAFVREALGHSSPKVIWARLLIPIVTGILVYANSVVQEKIAFSNAEIIIQACERYHSDNGAYPKELTNLVPRYLSSIPHAKYSLSFSDFSYTSSDEATYLMFWNDIMWIKIYSFTDQHWFGGSP
jgi:hypothetical protein